MKKKILNLYVLAGLAVVLFSCSTGQKLADRSYGGGWAEQKVAATESSATESAVAQNQNETPGLTEQAAANSNSVNNAVSEKSGVAAAKSTASQLSNTTKTSKMQGYVARKTAEKVLKKVARKAASGSQEGNQLLCAIIAIFIPFLGVLLYEGTLTNHFWISLILTLLLYVPGLIYSLLIIFGVIG